MDEQNYTAVKYIQNHNSYYRFTDGDHVTGESIDAPIVLVENVAYNRHIPLHQNMWYTSSSTDTGDRCVCVCVCVCV